MHSSSAARATRAWDVGSERTTGGTLVSILGRRGRGSCYFGRGGAAAQNGRDPGCGVNQVVLYGIALKIEQRIKARREGEDSTIQSCSSCHTQLGERVEVCASHTPSSSTTQPPLLRCSSAQQPAHENAALFEKQNKSRTAATYSTSGAAASARADL